MMRLDRRCAVALLALLACSQARVAPAHDFWLQPKAFWISPDTLTTLTLQVGHGPLRQRSPIPLRRITRFVAIGPTGSRLDLRDYLQLGEPTADGRFQLQSPGAYVLVMQTDDLAQTHLPAIRFNDYLQVEGLTPALQQRARTHRMNTDGSESYSRCAKSLLQVGPLSGHSQGQIEAAVGMPLEIVPERSPFAEPWSTSFPVHVIFEGHPLAGALVKLTNLEHDASPLEMHTTDSAGRAAFSLPHSGTWLLNVIWTKALPASRDTDFETVFSSLSFGFPADAHATVTGPHPGGPP